MDGSSGHYDILGVSSDASTDEIRKAYKHRAMLYHPDKNLDNTESATAMFKQVAAAYEVLSNPETRAAYDRAAARKAQSLPRGAKRGPAEQPGKTTSCVESDRSMNDDENDFLFAHEFGPSHFTVDRAFDIFDMLFSEMEGGLSDPWTHFNRHDRRSQSIFASQRFNDDMHNMMVFSTLLSLSHGLGGFGCPAASPAAWAGRRGVESTTVYRMYSTPDGKIIEEYNCSRPDLAQNGANPRVRKEQSRQQDSVLRQRDHHERNERNGTSSNSNSQSSRASRGMADRIGSSFAGEDVMKSAVAESKAFRERFTGESDMKEKKIKRKVSTESSETNSKQPLNKVMHKKRQPISRSSNTSKAKSEAHDEGSLVILNSGKLKNNEREQDEYLHGRNISMRESGSGSCLENTGSSSSVQKPRTGFMGYISRLIGVGKRLTSIRSNNKVVPTSER